MILAIKIRAGNASQCGCYPHACVTWNATASGACVYVRTSVGSSKLNTSSHITFSVDLSFLLFLFFFQAEDGIRDLTVTGVQTCALPISSQPGRFLNDFRYLGFNQGENGK